MKNNKRALRLKKSCIVNSRQVITKSEISLIIQNKIVKGKTKQKLILSSKINLLKVNIVKKKN